MEFISILSIVGGCFIGHCLTEIHTNVTTAVIIYHMFVFLVHSYLLMVSKLKNTNDISIWNTYEIYWLLILYSVSSYINNIVWQYSITPMYQLCVRSCSPLFYVLIGRILFHQQYTRHQYKIAGGLCLGLLLVSWVNLADDQNYQLSYGLLLLIISNLLLAIVSHLQSNILRRYTNSQDLLLVMTHGISLPGLLVVDHHNTLSWSEIALYVMGQYLCVRSVYWILSRYNAFTLNIILTGRKCWAIIWSCYYHDQVPNTLNIFGMLIIYMCGMLY